MSTSQQQMVHPKFIKGKGIVCADGVDVCCINGYTLLTCVFNTNYAWRNEQLHFVAGSFAIGKHEEGPFFEYGGPNHVTFHDFAPKGKGNVNMYWLEDIDGNIYDVVTPSICEVAAMRGKKISYLEHDVICKKTKLECSKRGLHYFPASHIVQKLAFSAWMSMKELDLSMFKPGSRLPA